MKTLFFFFLALSLSLSLTLQSDAATRYARANGNWNNTGTWTSTPMGTTQASVPTAVDQVIIGRGRTVVVNVANAACASIQIGSPVTNGGKGVLDFKAGSHLAVSGAVMLGGSASVSAQSGSIDMTEGGILSCGSIVPIGTSSLWDAGKGTVELTAPNTLPSEVVVSFFNLTISARTVLDGCITVDGALTLAQGNLVTSAVKMLTLNSLATISGGSDASFVEGPMRLTWRSATASKNFPIGKSSYEPLAISLTTPSNPVLQAECFDQAAPGTPALPLRKLSTSHYYRASLITGTASKGGSVTILNDADLPTSASSLMVAQSVDPAGTFTSLTGNSGSNTMVTSTGYNPATVAVLALGTTDGTLPVELTSFTASVRKGGIVLSWATATEANNAGFEVERRSASSDWQKLGFIEGHGSSNVQHAYSYNDASVPAGRYTYRLKQIDRDGAYEYSQEVEATQTLAVDDYTISQNYPNPFNPTTNIRFAVPATQNVEVKVFNMLGQEVATLYNGIAEAGVMHTVQFNAAGLASGTYIYRLHTADRTEVKRMLLVR